MTLGTRDSSLSPLTVVSHTNTHVHTHKSKSTNMYGCPRFKILDNLRCFKLIF